MISRKDILLNESLITEARLNLQQKESENFIQRLSLLFNNCMNHYINMTNNETDELLIVNIEKEAFILLNLMRRYSIFITYNYFDALKESLEFFTDIDSADIRQIFIQINKMHDRIICFSHEYGIKERYYNEDLYNECNEIK